MQLANRRTWDEGRLALVVSADSWGSHKCWIEVHVAHSGPCPGILALQAVVDLVKALSLDWNCPLVQMMHLDHDQSLGVMALSIQEEAVPSIPVADPS
jgi:hypothetical protein